MKQINITFFLTMLMSMVGLNTSAHDIAVQNADGKTIYYNYINNNTELAVTYRGSSSSSYSKEYTDNVVIPESVTYNNKTYSVTSIGSSAFSSCSGLTAITIPNSVTSIGESAFYYCSGLTSVTIPNGVTSIGGHAFYGCKGLTSIKVHDGNTKYDSRNNCNAIIETTTNTLIAGCNNTVIPNSVTSIGSSAFFSCSSLTSVTIPDGVTSIGSSAFDRCSGLISITIPNSVTSIGEGAFSYCSGLTSVTWNAKKCTGFSSYDYAPFYGIKTRITEFKFGEEVEAVPSYLCYGMTGLTSITIPNSVTSIGGYAFYNTNLKSVTIGTGVLSIGSSAFSYNSSSSGSRPVKVIWLTNTPPSGYANAAGTVNYVANDLYTSLSNKTVYPFLSSMFEVDGVKYVPVSPSERTCDAIDCAYNETAENINIGKTVSYQGISMKVNQIKPYACYGNNRIKDVKLSLNGNIGDYAFQGCTGIQNIEASNNGYIGDYAFQGCTGIQNIEASNNGYIGISAFQGCTGIQSVNVTNNGNISGSAFKGCTGIQTIEVSNSGNIGSSAFEGCIGVKTAIIKNKGYIGEKAFYNCTTVSNPATFEIANSGNIVNYAFSECKGMQSAVITNNGSIGDYAFQNCGMQTATLGERITSLGSNAFSGCSKLQSIIVPDGVTSMGNICFLNCSSMTSAKIGSGIQAIPTWAFSGCSKLTDMQIGQNVRTIDTGAFASCFSLPIIEIPKSVTSINNYAFSGCSKLAKVTLSDREDNTELKLGSNGSSPIFSSCPLDEVYIGRNISYSTSSSDGYSPFYRNTSLRSITITDRETEISENEFYGCTNLKEVKIGDGVTTIDNRAFSGCSSLDFFSFGSAVQTIGQEAFSDCTAMTKLISKAATPPTCGTQALDDINKWNCKLLVPAHTLSLYQAAPQWKEFFFIEEATGIKGITGDNTSSKATITSSYDLNGKQFSQPQKGLNILKMSDGTTRKVVK